MNMEFYLFHSGGFVLCDKLGNAQLEYSLSRITSSSGYYVYILFSGSKQRLQILYCITN